MVKMYAKVIFIDNKEGQVIKEIGLTSPLIGVYQIDDDKMLVWEETYIRTGFFVKFGGTSSIVNKESWLSVVCFLPYCTSAFLPL